MGSSARGAEDSASRRTVRAAAEVRWREPSGAGFVILRLGMSVTFRIVSLGVLAAHPLRGEKQAARPGHGTTTLIESGEARILVDPALPPNILRPRLKERTGYEPDAITHVFLTSFRPELRQGLPLFHNATWWISEREREAVGVAMVEDFKTLEDLTQSEGGDAQEDGGDGEGDDDRDGRGDEDRTLEIVRNEIALLRECKAAPDRLAERVDLFPRHVRTPGHCGLVVAHPNYTAVVCGDAIPTIEHLEAGQVLPDSVDLEQARESFQEAIEIADVLILGRDNMVINPMRRPF